MKNKPKYTPDFSDFNNRPLFIAIPKTASASMSLAPFILKNATPDRPPTTEFHMNLPFRFSFVRDPYDRIASCILNLGWSTTEDFERFIKEDLIKYRNIIEKEGRTSTNRGQAKRQQLWTMTEYLFWNGKLEVDFLGRFENLKKDWAKVCEKIGYEFELPHENKSNKSAPFTGYDRFYTSETRKIVGELYSEDFDNFEYSKK